MSILRQLTILHNVEGTAAEERELAVGVSKEIVADIVRGLRYGDVRVTVEREDIDIIKEGEGRKRVSGLPDAGKVSG